MAMKADLHKKTLNLRTGDWEYLESLCKPQGIATSEVVRILVSNYVDKKRAQETPPDFSNLNPQDEGLIL